MTVRDEIVVKRARKSDLASISSLLAELMEALTDTDGFDLNQSIENCRSLILDPSQYVLVARKANTVIGFINFSTRKTLMHPASSALIDELVVSRNYQGAGIGKRLISAAVDKCRELGCCEVEVSTEKSNSLARRFCEALGFEEDAVLLERDLTRPKQE